MNTEKAIDLLDNLIGMIEDNQENDYDTAFHMAIDALKAQAERTEERTETHSCDCISRQAAIAEIARWIGYIDEDMILRIQTGLKTLPSAQPEVLACGEGELSAQSEPPWIPVSERLPEQGRPILFCDVDGDVFHGFYKHSQWNEFLASYPIVNVVAWMPQPKSYKGVKNG